MAEAGSAKTIKPPRQEYLDVALPNGKDEKSPPLTSIRSIEEHPGGSAPKDPSESLIEAVEMVFRAVNARIAKCESEAARLRQALLPFAGLARQNAPIEPSPDGDALEALLKRVIPNIMNGEGT